MPSWEFPADDVVELQVRTLDGQITVRAQATSVATVVTDGDEAAGGLIPGATVDFDGRTLSVTEPFPPGDSPTITVGLPEGSSCRVDTTSADVRCHGRLAALDVHTISGDVSAELVTGLARVDTASGDVELREAGEIRAETASGDVRIGRVSGDISVRTASGDVQVAGAAGSRADVKSASGDIRVSVPPGIAIYLDLSSLSGTARSELEPAGDGGGDAAELTLTCRSISGDVTVSRAA